MAGLVPCALSGTSSTLRCPSPFASSAARIASTPQSSPCAPALGLIATECMPVSVTSQCASWSITSSAPWQVSTGASGVQVREPRQPRHPLVEAGIVLHRARAEREQAQVDRVVLAAEAGVVAHRLGFGEAREADRRGAGEVAQSILPGTGRGTVRRRVEGGAPQGEPLGALPLHHWLRQWSPSPFRGGSDRNPPPWSRSSRSRRSAAPRASARGCR